MQNKKLNSGIMSWLVPSMPHDKGPVATPPRSDGNAKRLALVGPPRRWPAQPGVFGEELDSSILPKVLLLFT